MSNKNYQKGVRFERERKAYYENLGRCVIRASGSHGKFDLVCIDDGRGVVTLIQCKVTNEMGTARRLLDSFRDNPPCRPMKNIHQTMEVKVTGSTEVHSCTV